MKTNTRFLFSAGMALAMAFIVSCSSDDGGGGEVGDTSSSSGGGRSSSSGGGGRSSSSYVQIDACGNVVTDSNANTMTCNGQTYNTIVIGSQTWMAENLNYAVEGSRCYDDDHANCTEYGRMYDWATAMKVCPSGWHLPSTDDWDTLMNYVQTDNGSTYASGSNASIAGKYLKATSGWNDNLGESGNGEDKYGFAALPGGNYGNLGPSYQNVGYNGHWWSSTEDDDRYGIYSGKYAYGIFIGFVNEYARRSSENKDVFFSVRCVQGDAPAPSSSSSSGGDSSSSSSDVRSSSSSIIYTHTYGSLAYEGQIYRTIEIDDQTWMADNLNYNAEGSKCYGNADSNCVKYGRLYDWATAMDLPENCNSTRCASQINAKHRGICPDGWHIPSAYDWDILMEYVQDDIAGKYLKAASGWNSNGNGEDKYGFAALPGGYVGYSNGSFYSVGDGGNWWGSKEGSSNNAYNVSMNCINETVRRIDNVKSYMFSVRCVQD